ncbi:Transcriptional activator CadC [Pragia fontium]|uniref:Transcriptional regulator n=2 Tax=Pragia fontium TaxID=82985 RepID=A0ABQ5LJ10_9GAMM|nr:transcriptional regulator [Pragia fontium]SUB81645.1 Transcriptional activator CadC [Pragia fontium]
MKDNNMHCFVNGWLIDHESGSIIHKETKEVKRLGEYQLKLLDTLAQHAGVVLSRERLTSLVWEKRVIGNNSLPNAIHALRAALDDDGKNQKVIKTIPKKGYLLEKEFCKYQEQEAPSNPDIAEDEPLSNTLSDTPAPEATSMELEQCLENHQGEEQSTEHQAGNLNSSATATIISKIPSRRRRYPFYIGAVVMAALAFAIGVFFFNPNAPISPPQGMVINKEVNQPYDHINLYQVSKSSIPLSQASYSVPERLKESLNNINGKLRQSNATLDVYYRATDSILHYTISIKTSCEHKELSMNIYHWRINNERLNTLIYHETERKLNELATCNN